MLNPNNDRLDYGQMLSAPDGYILDFAVGTTYSLDLDALVGACIALGLSEETDSELMKNPICLLEALRGTGDKVALFCEGGQIHLPNNVTALYILLEQMVYQVNAVKRDLTKGYPSFHPKFWLIRYVNDVKTPLYRVIILSRNLTFDRSWDVCFYMDGEPGEVKSTKNKPIIDFLRYLTMHLSNDGAAKDKIKKIESMMRELSSIVFQTGCKEFSDFEFLPSGMKSSSGNYYSMLDTPLFQEFKKPEKADGLDELLILSPFISKDVIRYFNIRNQSKSKQNNVLITRQHSLANLTENDCTQFRIYTMKDAVLMGKDAISGEDIVVCSAKQDIHAKVYMTRKNEDTDLYLGSLNASHNAVFGNVEFMICLRSKKQYLNLETLTASLWNGPEGDATNPFQCVTLHDAIEDQDEAAKKQLDIIIKALNRANPSAEITKNGDLYDVIILFDSLPKECEDYLVKIQPLLANKQVEIQKEIRFASLGLTDLSVFYVICVSDGTHMVQRVIKIPTNGMPENREKDVISNIVHDKACFYRYVAFLLGDNYVLSLIEVDAQNKEHGAGKSHHHAMQLPPLYEKMLQTAWSAPERFQDIDYLLQAVSKDDVIPEGFENVYATFRKAVKIR